MFAIIQSLQFQSGFFRVYKDPVFAHEEFRVYKLVDSSTSNVITCTMHGKFYGTFEHIALDNDDKGYVFDLENKDIVGSFGKCIYIED